MDNFAEAWQDDIVVATRGSAEEHLAESETVLQKLQDSGYRASVEKSKLFQHEEERCGYQFNSSGIKPTAPNPSSKKIRSFLGSVQYLAKFIKSSRLEWNRQGSYSKKRKNGIGERSNKLLLKS